jgi:hypothetical protein
VRAKSRKSERHFLTTPIYAEDCAAPPQSGGDSRAHHQPRRWPQRCYNRERSAVKREKPVHSDCPRGWADICLPELC